jgi:hypothetical protein
MSRRVGAVNLFHVQRRIRGAATDLRLAGLTARSDAVEPEVIASEAWSARIATSGELVVGPEKGFRMLEFTLVSAVQPGA